jgi:hypothetical protein|tara:strand:+ start:67886 stop:68002 length:117 start_codon:yes stop_codon:yes gene_type:complete
MNRNGSELDCMDIRLEKYDPEKEYFFKEGCFITGLSNS